MALAAGNFSPDVMQVSGLPGVALCASQALIKLEAPVGVSQILSAANFFGNG
jgi:hypothetical protein